MAELEEAVRFHNDLYFVKKTPKISDSEFDRLVEALKRKNPHSLILSEIGSDLSKTEKTVIHDVPMLSLDKCYSEKDLDRWADKFEGEVIASPKIDGCAVAIRYDTAGNLQLAATRGSGVEGELITANVRFVKGIPQKIGMKNIEVRGEVYMPLSVFEKFSEQFANPRNLAAGAIKQKDPKKTAAYHLSFFAYDVLGTSCKTEEEKRVILRQNHFSLVGGERIEKNKMESVFKSLALALDQATQIDPRRKGVPSTKGIID